MSRLVRMPPPLPTASRPIAALEEMLRPGVIPAAQPDNYLERIAKYIPFEVLAFFIVINAILDQAMKSGGDGAAMAGFPVMGVAIGALLAGMILSPLFVWYVHEEGDAWVTNAVVSTLAFPFWAYAVGAVAFSNFHDGNLAAILLATFSVASGLVAPRAVRPEAKQAEKAETPEPERPAAPIARERPTTPTRPQLLDTAQL
jgi:hypothetical protein